VARVSSFVRNAGGKLVPNPSKLDVQSFYLVPDNPNNPVTVGAGATSPPILFTVGQDGPFEGFYLTHEKTNQTLMTVDIYDEAARRHLMNRPVHIDTIMGQTLTAVGPRAGGIGPHLFAETLFMQTSRSLSMTFVDGAAGNTVWPSVVGRRFYNYANPSESMAMAVEKRGARARFSTPYFLTTTEDVSVAGAATGQQFFLQVTPEAHFEWFKLMVVSTGAFSFRLYDARNNRAITNDFIHVSAAAGQASFPMVLPEPILYQANTRLRLEINELSGAANDIYFTMGGRRIYVA